MRKFGVGVIGCGSISGIYLENCKKCSNLAVVNCADIDPPRAEAKAEQYGVPKWGSVEELLSDDAVDIVLNLTIPKAHHEISMRSLEAGKHLYNEKPLGINLQEGQDIVAKAKEKGKLLAGAPDTFLGAGLQTCRQLIDEGAIGRPVSATAFMQGHGHEGWHPNAEFYYQPGGGPMLDMGPYYITALVTLLGSVQDVAAMTGRAFEKRTITAAPRAGTVIEVQTSTHLAGNLRFAQGAIATVVTSFDVWSANVPLLEIHGTEGSLSLPDPNTFKGPVRLYRSETRCWEDVALTHGFAENSRGLGVSDLAFAIEQGRPPRASGDLMFHVLETMLAFDRSSSEGAAVKIQSQVERPSPMPVANFESFSG